ncbi:TrmB family transcriptional regulator [Halobacteria archaeon AArc-curdl1]|uniref:TrmB family transcriptional regulator n=1 Tax=Natronosalvus hydrolyticus TaxID=2979988 RepID=A0AAP3E8D9_9EURY|nr:TrmB family transcriptional regulator [Halobacteria archaeon AArc-curdl1]
MESEKLIETLEDAGLSPYQADAYVTLLELGASSATDIAKASTVPDPRIYDVLRSLQEKEYIETYKQNSLHARAHAPEQVLSDLRDRATAFESAADEIEDRWMQPDIEAHNVSIVKRMDTVLTQAADLIRSATSQIQIGLTPAQFDELEPALAEAKANGVDIKLCLFPKIDESATVPATDRLAETCTEARWRKVPSPFLALIDRSWTFFSPHGSSTNQYGVIVNDRTHAYVFHWYFISVLWEVHEELYTERSTEPPTSFVDIRHCVRSIEPYLDKGIGFDATVTGFDTETGAEVEVSGKITGITYGGISDDDEENLPLAQLAGEASITLETDDTTYTVGGWGAMIEDLEATRITINDYIER